MYLHQFICKNFARNCSVLTGPIQNNKLIEFFNPAEICLKYESINCSYTLTFRVDIAGPKSSIRVNSKVKVNSRLSSTLLRI